MAARGFGKWINIAFGKHNVIWSKSRCNGIVLLSGLGHLSSSDDKKRSLSNWKLKGRSDEKAGSDDCRDCRFILPPHCGSAEQTDFKRKQNRAAAARFGNSTGAQRASTAPQRQCHCLCLKSRQGL